MTPWIDERREHPRVSLEWPATVRRTGDGAQTRATTLNLSCGGIYFLAREPYQPGERAELLLLLPEDLDPRGRLVRLRCSVTVVRVDAAGEGGYGVACRIHDYQVMVGPHSENRDETPIEIRKPLFEGLAEAS